MGWYSGHETPVPYYNLLSGGPSNVDEGVYHVEAQYNRALFRDQAKVIAGGSWRVGADNETDDFNVVDVDRRDIAASLFGQVETRVSSTVRLVAATRWDQGTLYDGRLSPKLAVVVTPTPRQSIRATINQAFRAPTPIERFSIGGGAPNTNPRVRERAIETYFAGVSGAVSGGTLPASVTAGLDVGPLPWTSIR